MKKHSKKALVKKIKTIATGLANTQRSDGSTLLDSTTNETQPKENIQEVESLQGKFESIQEKSKTTGLPENLMSGIENLSGFSMDDVKVHYNSAQPAQLNALAYAQGNDIHVAPEQEKHLPHEAWHVVQQKQGRVNPTKQMKEGNPVNDDAGLETAADKLGTKAIDFKYIPKKK